MIMGTSRVGISPLKLKVSENASLDISNDDQCDCKTRREYVFSVALWRDEFNHGLAQLRPRVLKCHSL